MKWQTAITKIANGTEIVRGVPLTELAEQNSFVGNLYFILTGNKATKEVERLLDVALSLSIDHGVGPVSTQAMRIATSANISLQQSLIVAIASMGEAHGGAAEEAAKWFEANLAEQLSAEEAVRKALASKRRIPGFGHAVLAQDSRAKLLFDEAKRLHLFGVHGRLAEEVAHEIEKQKGKPIPLNIDGALAAVTLDLGFPAYFATGLFVLGRIPGLLAHVREEKEQRGGLRRLPEEDIVQD